MQTFSASGKFILFFILELANAYFFGHLFMLVKRNDNTKTTELLFNLIIISLTTFISVIFLKTIIFMDIISIIIFSMCYTVSLIITIFFFFYESYSNAGNQANSFVEKYTAKLLTVIKQFSFWFLILIYVVFYSIVIYELNKVAKP